jgi:hypothetical protein
MAAKLLVRRIARTLFVAVRRFRSPGRLIHGHVRTGRGFSPPLKDVFAAQSPFR